MTCEELTLIVFMQYANNVVNMICCEDFSDKKESAFSRREKALSISHFVDSLWAKNTILNGSAFARAFFKRKYARSIIDAVFPVPAGPSILIGDTTFVFSTTDRCFNVSLESCCS